ncbi:hypothetical protein M2459_001677 [Parabacteroides sp. PF5-5]|uniref:DUF5916 domain-containing protein n=1 Tax=unclassified Parabacteroides TaxID=2649774 RepID=UPI0024753DAE|nr:MULTISPECIES: DUF5916 domain-containing protein [unclassified Parabacteroides]MDH6304940.1 hypothetical protein [Parabacteroides sp. PH5-39]MDH6315974.1 hypothetical protein [Parabacteroides sp. PF5-13]MDH6319631.1 hypothetical protein [Parabacteroides sp. PH5-13]MDH6323362.1 hypothetical protein [Parabacteroides sp. PH5-8]MDH6327129.1 hypothetical protein [Parabacteroides sp. PH5-41]
MKHASLLIVCFYLFSLPISAQSENSDRSFAAVRVSTPPIIDGLLLDDCWENTGEWSGTFVQQQPDEGNPETEETHLKILYDNHNIYVAFRAYDSQPEKINRWLAPRDQIKGDAVCIMFDSYADKRTGFAFALTAGGTRADFLCSNTNNDDYTWNAVWEGKVSYDNKGWYAEFRIPLSQLRYSGETEQEWGFHALRKIDRKQETDHLHLIPRNNKGFVFSFETLTGISNLPKSRRVELSPYTSLKYQTSEKEAGNPYATGSEWGYGVGLDGKIGLSSDFTLDFTINPDFGQVEADPSTINLTAFETWYEEKRPFFLEGKNIFDMMGESMFYSRRIGARPRWSPDDEEGRYSSVPQQTHIISAIKVSGKNRKGLSVGVLNSITSKECAKITENGSEYNMTAQPLTSYSVARVQQDIKGGNTILGGMLTSTNRSIKHDHLSFLPRNAYTGALDFTQYFKEREYYIMGSVQYSHVEGSKDAMIALQESPVHYYQREDASYVSVDSSRSRMSGSAGNIVIGRGGGKKIVTEHRFVWATPGFELNDMGYLQNADYKLIRGHVGYVENKPQGIFRNYVFDTFYRVIWDYGKTNTFARAGVEGDMTFTNKWGIYACAFYDFKTVENGMLRGGPAVLLNPRWGTDLSFWSDQSKKVGISGYHGTVLGDQRYAHFAWGEISYRPIPNLALRARVNYTYWDKGLEYAGQEELDSGKKAYLMSSLRQDVLGLTIRMDYSITPDLSIQFYGSPFMSSGKYTEFKRATNTKDKKYANRFGLLDDVISYNKEDNTYSVVETNGDSYTFDNPDFSFREFRFNLVARWEYRPNSTIYLVWGQDRSGSASEYISSFSQNTKDLFNYSPTNVFMVKLNYWFTL